MRAAHSPSRDTSAAMDRTPPRRILALVLPLLAACATPPEGSAPPPPTSAPVSRPTPPTRTVNHDPRSVGVQPDYDGEAAVLREAVRARLPDPLPASRRAACTTMLDAAATFYGEVEPSSETRAPLLANLQATRADDLTRCEQTTSVRAAACVQVRLGDRDAELPWLLDQCTRAFPD